ncbi:tetratricopeptide repeat protein [Bacteroidota bacterium]
MEDRRHIAVMFTDIVGYTSLMGSDEDKAFDMLKRNHTIHATLIKKHNGKLIKEVGDGTLCSFPLASDAVRCAMDIQKEARSQKIPLKIGIHQGEMVMVGTDVLGDAVNVASRLQESAEEGCISISGAVFSDVKNKSGIEAEFIGEKALKNVEEPVKVYRVQCEEVEKAGDPEISSEEESRPSIAVLPFVNMSDDASQEYFCDGMTEEIINTLSHVENLKVIARTSAFIFKDRIEDMRIIGKKLDVEHLLEGSVRKAGNRLRITSQLIKVTDGSHIWSEKYDREIQDVFAIQDEISLAIVDNLKARLLGSEKKMLLKRHTEKSEAYNLYLLGRFYTNKRNEESLKKAIEYFLQAIRKDPGYALAFAGLSEAYALVALGYGALPSKEGFPNAREAALKAIEIDDELAEAYTSLAFVKQYSEFDWPGVEQAYKRAIELNPGYAPAHQWYGEYFFIHKRWDESYREISNAIELDPLSFIIRNELGWYYHYQNKIDQAIEQYKQVVEMAPDYAVVYFNLGNAYVFKGMYEEAIEMSEKAVKLSGGSPFMKAGLAYVYTRSGKTELAVEIRDELVKLAKSGYLFHGPLATVYVALNEKDKAIKWLKSVYQNKEASMYLFRAWYEDYLGSDLLSDDPWFNELQKKVGLE